MNEERNPFYHDDFEEEIVRRYEDMLKKEKNYFFDVHEFEDIIDFYIDNEQITQAAKAIDIAKRQHPASSVFTFKNAQILIDRGEPVKALRLLGSIEQVEASNDEIYLLKATAYNMLGELKEAIRQWEKALELNHEDKEEQLFSIGVHLETGGHYKLAIRYFKQALEINPENLGALYEMAFCYERLDDINQSLLYYNLYLDVEPYSEMIWFRMGQVFEKAARYEDAVRAFDYAAVIEENFSLAYLSKAKCLDLMGDEAAAVEEYMLFLKQEGSDPDAYVNIGYCYEELAKPDQALVYYQQALDIEPQHAEAAFCIGQIYYEKAAYEKAFPYLKHAVQYFEGAPEYWYVLGCVQKELLLMKEAKASLKKALHIEKDVFSYWIDYADVFVREGNYERALKVIYDASAYCHGEPAIYAYFGIYLFYLGEMDKSIENFTTGFAEDPEMMKDILRTYPDIAEHEAVKAFCKP